MENNDLISRDDLIKAIGQDSESSGNQRAAQILECVLNAPSVDAIPVLHARWVDSPNIAECVVCSNCMSDNLSAQVIAPAPQYYHHCPCCGAKIDGNEANQ